MTLTEAVKIKRKAYLNLLRAMVELAEWEKELERQDSVVIKLKGVR